MGRIFYAIEDVFDQAAFDARTTWQRRLYRRLSALCGAYADRIKLLNKH